jgi:hypothetical protein
MMKIFNASTLKLKQQKKLLMKQNLLDLDMLVRMYSFMKTMMKKMKMMMTMMKMMNEDDVFCIIHC